MKRIIIFLVRKRLKLKKFQRFKFQNQRRAGVYYFDRFGIMKIIDGQIEESKVPLNWLLNDECKIELI